jgi:hypothetical protein
MPYYSFKNPREFNYEKILSQMTRLIKKREDLPDVNAISMMVVFMLPLKEETTYTKIGQSNIAKHLVEFLPKESISEIKRKADFKDPVSSCWIGME